jgi:hypothetical protein
MEIFKLKHGGLEIDLLFSTRTFRKVLDSFGIEIDKLGELLKLQDEVNERGSKAIDFIVNIIYWGMKVNAEKNGKERTPKNIIEIEEAVYVPDENSNITEMCVAFFNSISKGSEVSNTVVNIEEEKKT